ncbi:retrovirus-related Pol polyprotein from transposon 297 [Trichonephila clavipes]|nr:retrovirus-related Pol polyprotein from transposon 297 [Trichonephila clavipes]
MTWTTPELASPLLTTTPHQRENVSALDRFSVHLCPTRRVFSGIGLELVTWQATVRYPYHSATAATYVWLKSPLDEICHCLPLAKIKIKTKKGEFYTKAAIKQDSSDNDLYLLGNRTAELLESNEQGVQLVNAVAGEDDSLIILAFEGEGGKSLAKVNGVEFKEEQRKCPDLKPLWDKALTGIDKEFRVIRGKLVKSREGRKDVEEFVNTCDSCQQVRKPRDKAKAPLKLVPIIPDVFSKINIDVVGPLPVSTKQNRYLITSICVASKYPEAIPGESITSPNVSDDIEGDAEIPYPDKQCTKFDYHEILRESQLQLKLSPSQIDELKQVITKNKDVFSPDPETTPLMRMDIELISDKPIKTKPYRMSPRQINIFREEIKRLLKLGAIEIGQSYYTSPLILVESLNKDPRPCVDYRQLNEITRAEFFPLPNMEKIVEKVSAAPYVTVMDLSKCYFQIPLTPRAQRYAVFVTPFGTYISKKMMFGLWGTTHYIPNYSTIASPLTDALKGKIKKEKITWDEKCEKAFEELKVKLISQPILFAPDFATDFILQTDASEDNTRLSFGARAAGVHYRLFSVWTLVQVRLGKQWYGNTTVDEIASEAADCRLTYTMANYPQRR